MKSKNVQDLVSGIDDREEINVDGLSIPIQTLKRLMGEGYAHLRVYEENRTVSLWRKTCCACFTEQQLRGRE